MTTTASSRALRLLAAPLVVGALVFGAVAPAHADGRGPGPGPGWTGDGRTGHDDHAQRQCCGPTFDDGPNPETAPRLLEVLAANEAKAVFCLIGTTSSSTPTWSGRSSPQATPCATTACTTRAVSAGASAERLRADMEETSAAIREAVEGVPVPYYRVPYGYWGLAPRWPWSWHCRRSVPHS